MNFTLADYCNKAHAPTKQYSHLSLVEKHFQQEVPYLQPAELAQLFQYEMPSLPLNGTFMIGPTSPTRFDLISDVYHTQFYIRNNDKSLSDLNYHPITQRLWRLRTLLVELSHKYDLSWCGLYLLKRNIHSIEWALVKECSVGDALRCIIPVTPEWVQENNCAWTAHYERMCYVPNLSQLLTHQGYPSSHSQLCLPIFRSDGSHAKGILSCYSKRKDGFCEKNIAELCQICYDLGSLKTDLPEE